MFTEPNEGGVVSFVIKQGQLLKVDDAKLTLRSVDTFVTVKANCGAIRGKWMYEVQLHSKGIMQIGWSSPGCVFSHSPHGIGVGDTENSYGYDGSKRRIWHMEPHPYGSTYWRNGDIISICVDLDEKVIFYYRNGVSLGPAFENFTTNHPFCPAVSLSFNESLTANFGGAPFRYPIKDFEPLQRVPMCDFYRCETLLTYLTDLAHFTSKNIGKHNKEVKVAGGVLVSEDAAILIFASMIVNRLAAPLTNRYIVVALLFPFIKKLCVMRSVQGKSSPLVPGHEESTLGSLLTLLWDNMDYDEVTKMLKLLVNHMEAVYKEISCDPEYEKQRSTIVILTCLCNHTKTRKYLLMEVLFEENCLALFMYIKPPEEEVLEKLIPEDSIWMPGKLFYFLILKIRFKF